VAQHKKSRAAPIHQLGCPACGAALVVLAYSLRRAVEGVGGAEFAAKLPKDVEIAAADALLTTLNEGDATFDCPACRETQRFDLNR